MGIGAKRYTFDSFNFASYAQAFTCNSPAIMFSRRTPWDVSPNRLAYARLHHQSCGRPALDLSCSNPTMLDLAYDEDFYAELFDARAMAYDPEPMGLRIARAAVANK